MFYFLKKREGFTLVEIVVGVAVFLMFAIGVYSGIQFIFKVVYQSRLRILESGILNEQVEIVRNMSFHDVGIVNGSPAGLLTRNVTTTRNGVDFLVTRTIRNIDDPFDGTIGGEPNDLSPADYKLVDIEVICIYCGQQKAVRTSTRVAPKYLEGDPNNGALFVEVFDANAQPVVGATVHIVADSTDPTFDFTDTTGNDGYLRVVDLPAAFQAYNITVTKNGYTTDVTREATGELPNPVRLPATVIAEGVTSLSFSIDKQSSLTFNSVNAFCAQVGSVDLNVIGTKLIGTDPDTFLFDSSVTTDVTGSTTISGLVWDAYGVQVLSYDLMGTISALPVNVLPNNNVLTTLVLGPDTPNSLVVHVVDSITQQPLSGAIVTVSTTGYSDSDDTGVGHVRQTDWSGGSGQLLYITANEYWSDDGGVDAVFTPGDLFLKQTLGVYDSAGELDSSIFDLGIGANYVDLIWEPLQQPVETGSTSLKFRIASSNTTTPISWDYLGPDGTANTYYDPSNIAISDVHDGNRYVRYRTFLSTDTNTFTPRLSDLSITYTNSCTPPGQVYFPSLSVETYGVEVTRNGYQTVNESVSVSGDIIFSVELFSE